MAVTSTAPCAAEQTVVVSVCCSSGSHSMLAQEPSVTITALVEGKARLSPRMLRLSPPLLR